MRATSSGNLKHGHGVKGMESPTYVTWRKMRERCSDPNNNRYHCYGAKGIRVCERWNKFENFIEDMGERPAGMTLDRKKNYLGYYKNNCRWADTKTQAREQSKGLIFEGKTYSIVALAKHVGIKRSTLSMRLLRGVPLTQAIAGG